MPSGFNRDFRRFDNRDPVESQLAIFDTASCFSCRTVRRIRRFTAAYQEIEQRGPGTACHLVDLYSAFPVGGRYSGGGVVYAVRLRTDYRTIIPLFRTRPVGNGAKNIRMLFAYHGVSYVDYAKLMVWSFIAGFSEKLVVNVIGTFTTKEGEK